MKSNMKKILCIILACTAFALCSSLSAFGAAADTTYYFDSENGSDSNSGFAENDAFASLNKISELDLQPGDRLLFKRGDVFSGTIFLSASGTAQKNIVFDAYGEGAKPLLTTTEEKTVIDIFDHSHITVSNLEITAPNGNGIYVRFSKTIVEDIKLLNITMHDIRNYGSPTYHSGSRAALRFDGSAAVSGAKLKDMLVDGCEIYDVGYGIHMGGTNRGELNENIIVQNCALHDIQDDAFIVAYTDGLVFRNSSVINACQSAGVYYTAAVWLHHLNNAVIENCEIAGQKNYMDGMTVDFDGGAKNSTYQYIYSHDNITFFWNCVYGERTDEWERNYGNTVRYCLSVNDDVRPNGGHAPDANMLEDYKFYNNTIVGGDYFQMTKYEDLIMQNNIFYYTKFRYDPFATITTRTESVPTISNNCFYMSLPFQKIGFLKNSVFTDPKFAGTDWTDINSFKLLKDSPCMNKGIQVEEDMGQHDFFGNELREGKHNIGCYDAEGVNQRSSIFDTLKVFIQNVGSLFTDFFE